MRAEAQKRGPGTGCCCCFFEAAFRHGDAVHAVDVSDVDRADVETVIAYSEGRYEPTLEDVSMLMRVQDRFLMGALRLQCESMLRAHVSAETWREVTMVAASYKRRCAGQPADMDVVAVGVQRATGDAGIVCGCRAGRRRLPVHVPQVLRCQWRAAYPGPDGDRVFDALGREAYRMWPGEVQVVMENEACMPRHVGSSVSSHTTKACSCRRDRASWRRSTHRSWPARGLACTR